MKAWMRGLTAWIMVGMVLGIVAGQICHAAAATPEQAKAISEGFTVITDIFLRLVKMIIAPPVLAPLVAGIAPMNDTQALARLAGRTLLWVRGGVFTSRVNGLGIR